MRLGAEQSETLLHLPGKEAVIMGHVKNPKVLGTCPKILFS
jgi:hypothetical protein